MFPGDVKCQMAGGMIVLKIVLVCKIIAVATEDASLSLSTGVDAKGRVIEAAPRIVGGEPVDIKTYPFMVSVQWRIGSKHHCGGTYILPRFVLSAAHCMIRYDGISWQSENPRFYVIVAGTTNLWYAPTWQIAVTDAVLPHPNYTYANMANDIGLYRLSRPLRLTPYVNFAPLPVSCDPDLFERNLTDCTVVGWGKTSETSWTTSNTLQHVKVPLMPSKLCQTFFTQKLHDSQICAGKVEGGVDACQGDSGGPLMCNGTQVGIVSWGHGCAAPRSPGVYCRVDKFVDWITMTTRTNGAFSDNVLSVYSWIRLIFLIAFVTL